MWESIKAWLIDLGDFLFRFTKTTAAGIIKKYGKEIQEIVVDCAMMSGTSEEKMAAAISRLSLIVPGIVEYVARAAIEVIYSTWKEEQEKIDTDGDGVPDYRDVCAEIGAPEGGSVTKDGCPVEG